MKSSVATLEERAAPARRVTAAYLKKRLGRALLYITAIALGAMSMGPYFWTVSSSLKTPRELMTFPPLLFPATPHWENYYEVWTLIKFARFALNSIVIATLTVTGQVASSAAAGYGFARFRFPGRDALFMLCLTSMMLPGQVTIIPLYVIFKHLHWLDTFRPLIVPHYFGNAFSIFLLRQFFMTLPLELDEAAIIDGASRLHIFLHIILPLSVPGLAAVAIFSFMWSWNDFFQPLIFLDSAHKFTLPLGLNYLNRLPTTPGLPMENLLMAAAVMMTIPTLIIFFSAQKYFIRGIAMSGIKG